jgi:protein-S-isoprenylcysteine O-methyltransferase Ste14
MRRGTLGTLLVALQLVSMAVLALAASPVFARLQAPPSAWFAGVVAVALAAWALHANRPGNFNIRPQPREGGRLVVHGPYRWIRHPMYSAVFAAAVAAALAAPGVSTWAAAALLVPVLAAKALLEERWMAQSHPAYRDYVARTRRFVPWLL